MASIDRFAEDNLATFIFLLLAAMFLVSLAPYYVSKLFRKEHNDHNH